MTGPPQDPGLEATGPRRSAESTTCPSCNAQVVAGLPFCPECGKRVVQTPTGPACARCGTAAGEGTKYCPACGLDLSGRVSQQRVSAERLATGPASQYALVLLDESGAVANRFPLPAGETTIGREGAALEFPEDVFMSPLHVKIMARGEELHVRDLGSRNGTWLFLDQPHRLIDGDRILIGSQVLEYRRLGYPGPHPPDRDATRRMGSLVPSADIACVTQMRSDGSARDVFHLSPGRNIRVGRDEGDCTFPYDPSMSGMHAEIRSEDADFVVADVGSRNGVAVSVRGEVPLKQGSRFLVGDKMLRVETA